MFVNNDSAEKGCGAEATDVGTAGGGKGAVNRGDDPNGPPGAADVGGVGLPNDPGPRLDEGDDAALESGGQGGAPTEPGVFGYARLDTGYVDTAGEVGCPVEVLYGVRSDGVRGRAAGGITEEPGMAAVDFADKLLTLSRNNCRLECADQ